MKWKKASIVLLYIILASGCSSGYPTQSPHISKTSTVPPAPMYSQSPGSNNPTRVLANETLIPTPSVTKTSKPTPTFYPTVQPEEKQQILETLFHGEYLCSLPCIAGITPGRTGWRQAMDYLRSLATDIEDPFSQEMSGTGIAIQLPGNESDRKEEILTFYMDRDKIIELMIWHWFDVPLQEILNKYGKPEDVLIYILDIQPQETIGEYDLVLDYGEKNFVLLYSGTTNAGETLEICPGTNGTDRVGIWSWSEKVPKTLKELSLIYGFPSSYLDYHSVSTISSLSITEFYNIFKEDQEGEVCFTVSNPHLEPGK